MGLFKPAWMKDDWESVEKALRAVEKENNQSKLYEIAKNALYICTFLPFAVAIVTCGSLLPICFKLIF